MSGAAGFIWVMVIILALAWALSFTGTMPALNFGAWINVLLVLAVLGAVFNLFVVPFLGRSRTTRMSSSAQGTAVPPAAGPPGVGASGAAGQEVVQETRDRTAL